MLITRGQQGCLCYEKGEGFSEVPSFTNRIVDRIGAGDAVLAGQRLVRRPRNAHGDRRLHRQRRGRQAVEIIGNRSVVTAAALLRQINSLLAYDHWISTP